MKWLIVFAQDALPSVPPAASGWAATTITGAILYWIMYKHLPKILDGAAKERAEHAQALKDQADKNALVLKEMSDKHAQVIREITDQNTQAVKEITERSDKRQDALVATNNLHSREVRDDYKEKLNMILQHCGDESKQRSQEQTSMMALMSREIDALKQAIEQWTPHVQSHAQGGKK